MMEEKSCSTARREDSGNSVDPVPLTLADILEDPALGPRDRMPVHYRGPREVTAAGWVDFAGRLERGEEISLIQSLTAANRRVLDVGGGSGELARAVAARIGRCTAVEPHDQLVESIGGEADDTGPVDVFKGSAELLPFADAAFDAVYCAWVLPYVSDIGKAIAEMVRVCDSSDPDAKVIVMSGGSGNELLNLLNEVCIPVADEPYDHHGYLLSTAAGVLAEHGFSRFSLHRTEASIRFDEVGASERAATAAAVLTNFWYERHPKAADIRAALEPALVRHFGRRPHGIGDQGIALVARPAS
ncbi:class I SAM-dependent methyltransferase [Streptomyces acidiscabies]|uniref:Class I SAM-dependent methyltransferase n=1 Tax=Streptomyces acidiscabies TaxID=42234 RepID=A0AAP6ELA2_9ACTN|nr:class I SAM-dependent methyltransferase [Streptomyces acidiscabies]MBP5935514.1 class I SAM-dependent methyltransferase [Streptomyces sp. LBUM 1476]MBZ3916614.1 methyltransferase domain-containing protein [Streptomyces acidiscabies]MDX2966889.1 class I SAM-dependent methyltransferase [Streptomyces acidiscabies]MDX3020292.1 class I SAM-dependent methyltransferase [Streptomyces acidiscabies]MDX3791718.1 class I SAM-dependent methyltransferase [Streptomyces acidiscabies]